MSNSCGHDERFHLMGATNGCCACELEAAREAVKRLHAIVDKLPKCWRLDSSGKLVEDVPVVPGETYYCGFFDSNEANSWTILPCRYVGHAGPHVDYEWEIPGCSWDGAESAPGFSIYSTCKAAQAAGGKSDE